MSDKIASGEILFVFKVGHSVHRKAKPSPRRTHHWRCYVDSWSSRYPLSNFVKKVTFQLHESFDNPRQVVCQAPFAIEEDGFGNFRLLIKVEFFDCVTNFSYDLTLSDHNELYTYRTVIVDPAPDNWDAMTQLGGIAIPRNSGPHDVHEVLQTIQASSAVEKLHPYSFFPYLEHQTETELSSPHTSSSGSSVHTATEEFHSGWDREHRMDNQRTQHPGQAISPLRPLNSTPLSPVLPSQPPPLTQLPSQQRTLPPPPPPPPPPLYATMDGDFHDSAMRSVDRYLNQPPLLQKHKKKLQLLHEAQLLLEDAQKQQSQWAAIVQPHRSPSANNTPHYNLVPLSPTISIEPERPSPIHVPESTCRFGQPASTGSLRVSVPQDSSNTFGPVSRCHSAASKPSPSRQSPDSKSNSATSANTVTGESESIPGKRIKRSKSDRDRVEPCTAEANTKPKGSIPIKENRTTSSLPAVAANPPAKPDVRLTSLFDTDLLDHFDDGDDLHSKDVPVNQHPAEGNGSEITSGDRGLVATNQFADHSHLLLDLDEHEFEDMLSRSLFSQCHDSNNPGSPFVDMFGDEDQLQSDASMQSSDERPVSNLAVPARIVNPQSTLSDSDDGVADKKSARPAPLPEVKTPADLNPANRGPTKSLQAKNEPRVSSQTDSEPSTGKNPESTVKSGSVTAKGRLIDVDEQRGKSSVSAISKKQSITSTISGSKRPARDSQSVTSNVVRKEYPREISPLSCDTSEAFSGTSDKRAKITNRHSRGIGNKMPTKENSTQSKSSKKSDSTVQAPVKPPKSSKRDREGGLSVASSSSSSTISLVPQSTGLDTTHVYSPKLKASTTDSNKPKADKKSIKSKSDIQKDLKSAGGVAEKRPTKSKTRTVETKHNSPVKHSKPKVVFSEQDVELSSLSSSSSHGSSPSSADSATSPTPPMSSIPAPTTTTSATATSSITTVSVAESTRVSLTSHTVAVKSATTTVSEISDNSDAKRPSKSKSKTESKTTSRSDKSERKKTTKTNPCTTAPVTNKKPATKSVNLEPESKKPTTQLSDSTSLKKTSVKPKQERPPNSVQSTAVSTTVSTSISAVVNTITATGTAVTTASNTSRSTSGIGSATSTDSGTTEPGRLSNQELELLFDRLLCLTQPHLAIRMGEILLAYQKPTPQSSVLLRTPLDEKPQSTRSAVKILHDQPQVIAFNLRRLPIDCLKQLADLITEDEAISQKVNSEPRNPTANGLSATSSSGGVKTTEACNRNTSDGSNQASTSESFR
ncbi:Protein ENL [Fasciola hepatica]|uniref:Protein ENL n=1 Tax=Fasciola hepatica TaxID=6192 RepID=A0A4E0RFJ2_FASHE|nr:Protein ENL [Fasciola hepatica]